MDSESDSKQEMLDAEWAVGRDDCVTASDSLSETALNELADDLFRRYDSEEAARADS